MILFKFNYDQILLYFGVGPVNLILHFYMPYSFVLGYAGFRWDRNWLVVNYKGRAYTQRVEPKLALVEVGLPREAFLDGWEPAETSYNMGKNILLFYYFNFFLIFCLVKIEMESSNVVFFKIIMVADFKLT